MKRLNIKKENIITLVLFILICIICYKNIYILKDRNTLVYDEIISFYRASALGAVDQNRIDWINPERYMNNIFCGNDFWDELCVFKSNSIFNSWGILDYCKGLILGRQYNIFLNGVNSIFGNENLFFQSILLNVLIFAMVLVLTFKLCTKLYRNSVYGLVGVALMGLSGRVSMTVGYCRFYILYTFYVLLLIYIYYLLQNEQSFKRYIVLIVTSMLITLFGYNNSQYMAIISIGLLLIFVIFRIGKKEYKKAVTIIGMYGGAFLLYAIIKYDSIKAELIEGEFSGINMSQLKNAVYNFLYRSKVDSVTYFLGNIRMLLMDSSSDKIKVILFGIIIVNILAIVLTIKKKFTNELWWTIEFSVLFYILIISRIEPWNTWRYMSNIFFMVILLLPIGLEFFDSNKLSFLALGILFCLIVWTIYNGYSKENILISLDNDGPSFEDREYMVTNYNNTHNIYLYDGDSGTLFYGAYLWGPESKFYFSSADDIFEDTVERNEILSSDEVYIWTTNKNELTDDIEQLLNTQGFSGGEIILNTDVRGRHQVHKFVRK
ncbi:hypothetical protein SAMN04487831_103291 [Pseudobutyrivibrio sp. UC1225]|uniref:hypothetical protein n=1 Tax=Pseudobutyrivibrio sp. UC1225 TaxID=1798185 RepID=UPI0008EBAEF3|nr:hypothetical protein [Pseudobutyrivibrio sp. UC1225]SFN78649.1 hypothetical protein SAMN04487831_103291 [Pseudobutyrivibrio sp. UC1225]